jgi:pilus assembly protein FimV
MALGFGFNKAKVLASAEKFVQQGKLPNAIAEYEKIIREDPKDVTVLNTIGDLYARVGQNEHAAMYFKKVADQYAQSGFTVKAIAVYKKLVKLQPNTSEVTLRLAELYTQQGLFNDARAQYMHVADGCLRSGDNNQAARVLQRILELDPENASTQARLADLYLKIGKKEEAQKIFQNATEALYAKGAYDAAAEALGKLLKLDPSNGNALRLRGMIAAQKGDSRSAVEYLEQAPDLDSKPEALRALLRAQLDSGNVEGAEFIANKLLNLHKDPNGTTSLVEWYIDHDQPEKALRVYEQNADRLLAAGSTTARDAVAPLMARMGSNPEALKSSMRFPGRTGDSSQTAEMMETQAHAFAQKGEFAEARDLYKKLNELEPENALHAQNYRQMLVKLGEDSASRILSPEEAAQAFMVEELDSGTPVVQQKYDPPTESAIEAALTDAELFVSYNVPSKAIPPLEAALPLAPQDITLNQRLASLYARAERWSDAARICQNLSDIYRELGHPNESARYQEAAKKYGLRSPGGVAPAPARPQAPTPSVIPVAPEPVVSAPAAEPAQEHSIQEFSFDVRDQLVSEESGESGAAAIPVEIMPAMLVEAPVETAEKEAPAPVAQQAEEIDLSGEWESMLTVEEDVSSQAAAGPAELEVVSQMAEPEGGSSVCYAPAEKVQEVQFYISQQMWEQARKALLELQEIAPEAPEVTELMAAVAAGKTKRTASRPVDPFASTATEPSTVDFLPPPFAAPAPHTPQAIPQEKPVPKKVEAPPPASAAALGQSAAPPATEPVLEISAPPPRTTSRAEPTAASTEDILGDFIHDLEEKELSDFVPRSKPEPAAAPANAATMNGRSNGELQDAASASVLNDILSDLQEETAAAGEGEEDPETHYNLGIAFKEMGLLDEAIGELQKVCRAVDRGHRFSQPIQAYTWLAQCLVDKGAPEAAVRWYQKALQLPGMDDSSRLAVYYDLAAAYEASGDRKAALANFMEVYGSNIDFRDVAGRIKALKS